MTHTFKNLSSLFIASMSVVAACQVAAQDERWFRVELLIVSQGATGAENSEAWDPTPTLAYPKKARFLFEPDKAASNLARLQATSDPMSPVTATSNIDELGYQTITLSPVDETTEDTNPELAVTRSTDPLTAPLGSELEVMDAPTTPSPFTALPHSELEFRGKAAYMARTGRYKTLFHESWLQRVATQENAIPIVIDHSGDDESWPALQGSVTFYLSRFLHLQTNLWLNTTGSYLPAQWIMPLAPLGPKSLIVIQPPQEEPSYDDQLLPIDTQELLLSTEEVQIEEQAQLEPEQPLSPWRHAILLSQERRMRSTEVHYIDHPLLGVIVKISPVTKKELLQRAEAEAKDNAAALTTP
jgi:hypothetical protein